MITLDQLKIKGFVDVSPDKNGLSYRKYMPCGLMEITWYRIEPFLRYQTTKSGVTINLKGVETIEDLENFHQLMYNQNL